MDSARGGIRWRKAGTVLLLCAGAILGCSRGEQGKPAGSTALEVDDRDSVIASHIALVKAWESGNVDAFVALLDPSPDLLIFHPVRADRFETIAAIRDALPVMFDKLGKAAWTEAHPYIVVNGNVAWLTEHFVIESANLETPFVGRATEIWVRTGDTWRLSHAHWSQRPYEE